MEKKPFLQKTGETLLTIDNVVSVGSILAGLAIQNPALMALGGVSLVLNYTIGREAVRRLGGSKPIDSPKGTIFSRS